MKETLPTPEAHPLDMHRLVSTVDIRHSHEMSYGERYVVVKRTTRLRVGDEVVLNFDPETAKDRIVRLSDHTIHPLRDCGESVLLEIIEKKS